MTESFTISGAFHWAGDISVLYTRMPTLLIAGGIGFCESSISVCIAMLFVLGVTGITVSVRAAATF
jgi:hypothetical protein